jgi:hypothetical protein
MFSSAVGRCFASSKTCAANAICDTIASCKWYGEQSFLIREQLGANPSVDSGEKPFRCREGQIGGSGASDSAVINKRHVAALEPLRLTVVELLARVHVHLSSGAMPASFSGYIFSGTFQMTPIRGLSANTSAEL